MHDWVLKKIELDWSKKQALFFVSTWQSEHTMVCSDVLYLMIPRYEEWGDSVCIMNVNEPELLSNGYQKVILEMQTGDNIEIIAKHFEIPSKK